MFRPTGTPIEPTDALAISEVATTLDDAVTEALVARPELQSLRIEMQVRDRLIDVVRADMKPSVEFVGGYGLSVRNPRNFFDFSFTRWAAGVTLTVPLFDGHRTAGRVAQAQADRNIVTQRIASLENDIRLDVQSAWDALTLANRTLARRRSQYRAGAPCRRDDRGELQVGGRHAARRPRCAGVPGAGGEYS